MLVEAEGTQLRPRLQGDGDAAEALPRQLGRHLPDGGAATASEVVVGFHELLAGPTEPDLTRRRPRPRRDCRALPRTRRGLSTWARASPFRRAPRDRRRRWRPPRRGGSTTREAPPRPRGTRRGGGRPPRRKNRRPPPPPPPQQQPSRPRAKSRKRSIAISRRSSTSASRRSRMRRRRKKKKRRWRSRGLAAVARSRRC